MKKKVLLGLLGILFSVMLIFNFTLTLKDGSSNQTSLGSFGSVANAQAEGYGEWYNILDVRPGLCYCKEGGCLNCMSPSGGDCKILN